MGLVRSIRVRDANGDELIVYEIRVRKWLRTVRRMKLCTGEHVEPLDDETFVLPATGEKLVRVGG